MIYNIDEIDGINLSPENIDALYIDVGLAIDAPHSALWIADNDKCAVVGIEPNQECLDKMKAGRSSAPFHYVSLKDPAVMLNGEEIKKINNEQLFIFKCAIDNVETPTKALFYHTDKRNIGCSSLLEPTSRLGLDVTSKTEIDVVPLEYVLDKLGVEQFEEIKFVKTDTQGKDFDVVQSLGKYLSKTVGLKCEYNVAGQYVNPNDKQEFMRFMDKNNFALVGDNGYDLYFFNLNFKEKYPPPMIEKLFRQLPKV